MNDQAIEQEIQDKGLTAPRITPADIEATKRPAYQQRVIDEKAQLDERLGKLTGFFATEAFLDLSDAEMDRLYRQAGVMETYSQILGERIDAFDSGEVQ